MLYPQLVTCSRIQSFQHPGNSFLWGIGALEELYRVCTGFLIMPKRPYEWRVHSHGCYKFDNAALGFGPRDQHAHLPVFLRLVPLTCLAPTASCAANMHNKEEWNAGITNMTVREEDVHDRDPVRQGHVNKVPSQPTPQVSKDRAMSLRVLRFPSNCGHPWFRRTFESC